MSNLFFERNWKFGRPPVWINKSFLETLLWSKHETNGYSIKFRQMFPKILQKYCCFTTSEFLTHNARSGDSEWLKFLNWFTVRTELINTKAWIKSVCPTFWKISKGSGSLSQEIILPNSAWIATRKNWLFRKRSENTFVHKRKICKHVSSLPSSLNMGIVRS